MISVFEPVLSAVEAWSVLRLVRTSPVFYPLANAAHILALATMFGALAVHHLARLRMGNGMPAVIGETTLPLARVAFAGVALTGLLLFAMRAGHYASNPAMQIKITLIFLAGVNAWIYHKTRRSKIARITALLSLALWTLVLLAGRWIGFV